MDENTVLAWIATAESQLAKLESEIDERQRDAARMRAQLKLMYELLATLGKTVSAVAPAAMGVRERVRDAAAMILREHGAPLRVEDIHTEFLRRRFPLPGSGTVANIAVHLADRALFTKPSRGVVGLAEWEERLPQSHRRQA